jgi:hypothetical protein
MVELDGFTTLIVLFAELLQYIVNDALNNNLSYMPIPHATNDFPIVQYAYDTIMILPANITHILHLKGLLQTFADSTGLRVNFHKSSMVPMNVSDVKLQDLASAFGYQMHPCPSLVWVTLWELPNLKWRILLLLTDRVERILNVCSNFLSYSGRLEMSKFFPLFHCHICNVFFQTASWCH